MNVRRGLLRLWIIAAALWVIGSGIFALSDRSIPSWTRDCEELRDFVVEGTGKPLGDVDVAQCQEVWRKKRLTSLEWTIAPPLALLVAGLLMAWIVQGFRSSKNIKLGHYPPA
jgi:hypothetical protein